MSKHLIDFAGKVEDELAQWMLLSCGRSHSSQCLIDLNFLCDTRRDDKSLRAAISREFVPWLRFCPEKFPK
jgi:hypothetical protein